VKRSRAARVFLFEAIRCPFFRAKGTPKEATPYIVPPVYSYRAIDSRYRAVKYQLVSLNTRDSRESLSS